MLTKIKLYFTYEHVVNDNYLCWATFDNGWCAFTHICSDPAFMFGDLWDNRPERQEALKLMGFDVEPVYTKNRAREFFNEFPHVPVLSDDEHNRFKEMFQNCKKEDK